MKVLRLASTVLLAGLLSATSHAGPGWDVASFSVAPPDAPKVVAAIDEFFASSGKEYPGEVTLLFNEADGSDPATHTILQTYPSVAAEEAFGNRVQSDQKMAADWAKLLTAISTVATPVQRTRGAFVANWGDIDPDDTVWTHFFLSTADAAAVLTAVDRWMNSSTGKNATGQVHLSAIVAGGIGSPTHILSFGTASQAEAEQWRESLVGDSNYDAFMVAMRAVAESHGANLLLELKSWGNPPAAAGGR